MRGTAIGGRGGVVGNLLVALALAVLWGEISSLAAADQQPADREPVVQKALDAPTTFEFIETPLTDVVDFLRASHKVTFQIDRKALQDVGIDPQTPVTRTLKRIRLRSALRLLLRDVGLTFTVRDGVVLITTREQAEASLSKEVYAVEDLVAASGQRGKSDFDALVDLITSTVEPASWDSVGGPGSISVLASREALVVRQTFQAHEQIAALLDGLRKIRAARRPPANAAKPAAPETLSPLALDPAPKIDEALRQPTRFEFVETPLPDVACYLSDLHAIPVQLDHRALADAGIDSSQPITTRQLDVPLRSALPLLLREAGLTYTIRDEVLLITTPGEAAASLSVVLYPVADLALKPGETNPARADFDGIIATVTRSVEPQSWCEVGGPGSIVPHAGSLVLVVSQTTKAHDEIRQLFGKLRRLPASRRK